MLLFSRMAAELKSVEPNGEGRTNAITLRARAGAAPLKRRCIPTQLETKLKDPWQRNYTLAAIATRLDAAEMPSGRCTFQQRSLWSTCKTILASPGGWSLADSMKRKSGPM